MKRTIYPAFVVFFLSLVVVFSMSQDVMAQCQDVEEYSPEMPINLILDGDAIGDYVCSTSQDPEYPPGTIVCESNYGLGGGEEGGGDSMSLAPCNSCPPGGSITLHGSKHNIGISGLAAIMQKLFADAKKLEKALKDAVEGKCEASDLNCETKIKEIKTWITIMPTSVVVKKCPEQGVCVHFKESKTATDDGNLFVSPSCARAENFCLDALMSSIREATGGKNDPCPNYCSYKTILGPFSMNCKMNAKKTLATATCGASGSACCDKERIGYSWKGQAHGKVTYECKLKSACTPLPNPAPNPVPEPEPDPEPNPNVFHGSLIDPGIFHDPEAGESTGESSTYETYDLNRSTIIFK